MPLPVALHGGSGIVVDEQLVFLLALRAKVVLCNIMGTTVHDIAQNSLLVADYLAALLVGLSPTQNPLDLLVDKSFVDARLESAYY